MCNQPASVFITEMLQSRQFRDVKAGILNIFLNRTKVLFCRFYRTKGYLVQGGAASQMIKFYQVQILKTKLQQEEKRL